MKALNPDLKRLNKYLLIIGTLLISGLLPIVSQAYFDSFNGLSFLTLCNTTHQEVSITTESDTYRHGSETNNSLTSNLICTEEEVDRRFSFRKIIKTTVITIPHFFAIVYNTRLEDTTHTFFSNFRHLYTPLSFQRVCILFSILRL